MFKAALSRGDFSLLDIVARQPCSSVAGTVPGKKKKRVPYFRMGSREDAVATF